MRHCRYVNGVEVGRRTRPRDALVPVIVTRAPASANARAIAWPMPDVPPVTSTCAPAKSNASRLSPHLLPVLGLGRAIHREREAELTERVLGGRRRRRAVQHGAGEVGELGFVRPQVAALLAHLRALPVGAVPELHPTRALDRELARGAGDREQRLVRDRARWRASRRTSRPRPTRSGSAPGTATRPPCRGCGWPSAATTSSASPSHMRNGRSQCEPVSITTPPPAAARSNRHGRSPP